MIVDEEFKTLVDPLMTEEEQTILKESLKAIDSNPKLNTFQRCEIASRCELIFRRIGKIKQGIKVDTKAKIKEKSCTSQKADYVYFIGNGLNKVKIGWSKFPENRMEELQTGSSEKLIMLGYISGTQRDERRLHKLFKKDHYRGEWFYLSANIQKYIKEVLNGQH